MLILIFFHMIPLLAMDPPNQDRLPILSDDDMIATAGRSPQHSRWMKDNCFDLHMNGDTWEDGKLQRFFCDGLFQHYFYQFTGYDYEDPYFQTLTKNNFEFEHHSSLKMIQILKISNDDDSTYLDLFPRIILWYKSIGNSLKSHPVFRRLGGHFQRFKIQTEKKENDLNGGPAEKKESILRELVNLDRKAIDCQVLLYHWIKTVCEEANEKIRRWYGKGEITTKLDDLSIIESIVTKDPWFLSLPVYRELIEVHGKNTIPETKRSYEDLKIFLIDIVGDLPDFDSLVTMAVKAFHINATDEEINSYDALFEAHRRFVSELSGVMEEGCGSESQRLEMAFGDLLMEKVRALRDHAKIK